LRGAFPNKKSALRLAVPRKVNGGSYRYIAELFKLILKTLGSVPQGFFLH